MTLVSKHWSPPNFWAANCQTCTEWTSEPRNDWRELVNMMHIIMKRMSSLLLSIEECPSTGSFLKGISP